MSKALRAVCTVYDFFVELLKFISCLLIVLMMLCISASVFLRHAGFGWVLEAAEYSLILMTLLGTGWALRAGMHIRVELWATKLPRKVQSLYNGIIYSVTCVACLVFGAVGALATRDAFVQGVLQVKVYSFPKWMILGVIPFGMFFLIVECAKMAYKHFKGESDPT
jgi:TRAP-type C4-dicarboxylate transport system permease small subunit